MKQLNKKNSLVIIFVLTFIFIINCNKKSTKPIVAPWSKITGKLAYSRYAAGDAGYLFIIDGSKKKVRLVKKRKRCQFVNLTWSSDGNKIIFSDFDSDKGRWQLYSINEDGNNLLNIYPSNDHSNYPAYSHDGRLTYWRKIGGSPQIWIDEAYFLVDLAKQNVI